MLKARRNQYDISQFLSNQILVLKNYTSLLHHCNHYLEFLRGNNLSREAFVQLKYIYESKLNQGIKQYFDFDNIY